MFTVTIYTWVFHIAMRFLKAYRVCSSKSKLFKNTMRYCKYSSKWDTATRLNLQQPKYTPSYFNYFLEWCKYSVRSLIGSLWANIKVITLTKWFKYLTYFVYSLGIMGPVTSDYNKRLILFLVIQYSDMNSTYITLN